MEEMSMIDLDSTPSALEKPTGGPPPAPSGPLPVSRALRLWAAARLNWPVWLVAGATFANGFLGIYSVLAVRYPEHGEIYAAPLPFGIYHGSRLLTATFGFVLIYLSFHLLARRQAAWWLALSGTVLAALAHFGHGHQWYTALSPIIVVAILLAFRKRFTVRSEPRSIAQGVGLMIASLLVALVYGTLGFWLLDKRDFGIDFSVGNALIRTLRELTLIGNGDIVAYTRHARWFLGSLHILGLVSGLVALYSLFRPVAYRLATQPRHRAMMKSILEQHGRSSLDYFKLFPPKSYFFSAGHTCGIAYATVGGIALSLGDPAGPAAELEQATADFMRFCADNGWAVAFHQAQPDMLPVYHRLGLQAIKIGEEAIVDLERFVDDTLKHSKHMRHSRNKFEKEGYKLARFLPPHEPALLDTIEEISREWLQIPGRHERGFSLGYFDRGYMKECPLLILYDPEGRAIAFVNQVPSYRPGEATIDLMRHGVDVPNGTMDYLFTALLLALKDEGLRTFDLGMAPYAGVGEEPGAPIEERAAHQLAEQMSRFVSYKGMQEYKAKFDPVWEDRYLVYQGGPLGLVRTAVALGQATDRGKG
jgi:phosphatidylglycerol lysyltransferase